MTGEPNTTLVKLGDSDKTIADRSEDIRGRRVIDKNRQRIGKVDALLLDEQEQKIRFLEVSHGGFLGIERDKSFIPIEAILTITKDEVHINQSAETIAHAPMYDPALANQNHFFDDTYGHYGILPFWGGSYANRKSIIPNENGAFSNYPADR